MMSTKREPSRQMRAASSSVKPLPKGWVFCLRHCQALLSSLGRLWRAPISSLMTIGVIGIALALPVGLYVLLQNIQVVSKGWNNGAQISLFLQQNVQRSEAQGILHQIQQMPAVASARYISPQQGLKQFEHQSGFTNLLAQLKSNPLPGVIVVRPNQANRSPIAIQQLLQQLKSRPAVDVAQLDLAWIKRLYGIINLGKHAVLALGILLAIAVLLIIGNTIRLAIQNYQAEIEVIKLVGGTHSFIRRPFLYIGILYGFFGAVLAYFLINILLFTLAKPVAQLATLYHSSFQLKGIDFAALRNLLVISIVLGLLGAWIAVARQLDAIEPQ